MFGKKQWNFEYDVNIHFGDQSGLLTFTSTVEGKISGSTSLAFD